MRVFIRLFSSRWIKSLDNVDLVNYGSLFIKKSGPCRACVASAPLLSHRGEEHGGVTTFDTLWHIKKNCEKLYMIPLCGPGL